MNSLTPGQMVIKIVNEELVKLMGSETTEIQMQPGKSVTVILPVLRKLLQLRHVSLHPHKTLDQMKLILISLG